MPYIQCKRIHIHKMENSQKRKTEQKKLTQNFCSGFIYRKVQGLFSFTPYSLYPFLAVHTIRFSVYYFSLFIYYWNFQGFDLDPNLLQLLVRYCSYPLALSRCHLENQLFSRNFF